MSTDRPRGWIPIARKMFDGGDTFWPTPFVDRYTRGEAWLDLIQMAAWRHGAVVNGVRLNRGEVCGSLRWFARRWSWGLKVTFNFFTICEKTDRIRPRVKQRSRERTPSIYLLTNYALYSPPGGLTETDGETERPTGGKREGNKDEEGEEGKNVMYRQRTGDDSLIPLALTPPADNGRKRKQTGPRPARAKTLLADDWQPNDTHRRIAQEEGRDLEREVSKFRDWAQAGAKRYASWGAAFRNWLRSEYGRPRGRVEGDDDGAVELYAGFVDVTQELSR